MSPQEKMPGKKKNMAIIMAEILISLHALRHHREEALAPLHGDGDS